MKNLIIVLCFLPMAIFAQSKKDYEKTMTRFMKFYNSGQADSINEMFSDNWKERKAEKLMWTSKQNKNALEEYGTLTSVEYLGVDKKDGLSVFKATFSKAGVK